MTQYVAGSRLTTNADLVDLEVLTDHDIEELTTTRMRNEDPDWATRHKNAWRETIKRLGRRSPPLTEDDLGDPTELTHASCFYVAYIACQKANSDRLRDLSMHYFRRWTNEVEEVDLTPVAGTGTYPRGSHGYMKARRG